MSGKRSRIRRKQEQASSGRPPKWLVMGTLATAVLGSGMATTPAAGDPLSRIFPARRFDLPYAVAALTGTAQGYLEGVEGDDRPALRFDIPAGPLSKALVAFQQATGLTLQTEDSLIRGIDSPGVSGLLTPDQALDELLKGTGVTYRFTDARTVSIDARLSETVDVVATPMPSSPKYLEPLRDTPQTLTVISQDLIEAQGATTLRDVLRNVTGISIQAGEGGGGLPGDNLTIRGFAARNDVFVDGVRDFGAYARDPYNVEQVEVTKGPGSIYGGRGTTGGSLNLSSKTPNLGTAYSGSVGLGTDEYSRATVDLNQPLDFGEGTAFRVNAMFTHADTPGRDAVTSERWGVSPTLSFGLGTPTRVTLSYSHLAQDNLPEYGIPWVPNTNVPLKDYADKPAPVDFDNFYGLKDRDYEETVTGIATAELEHDFTDGLRFRSLVRQGRSTRDSIITAPRFVSTDSTALNRQLQARDLTDEILAIQNDLTASFQTGGIGHDLLAGFEVAKEESENRSRTGPAAPTADLYNPNPDDPYSGPVTYTGARTESQSDTGAVYVADTAKIGERWQLSAGLRWDRFDVDFKSRATTGVVTPFERTDEMLSWRAGAVFKPLPEGSVYLAYGTSFNPSSDGNTGISLTDATVNLEPEKSRGYELGTKWDLMGGRLSVNSAVFRTEKTNARTPGINPGDPATVLEGEQRVDGFELGLSGRITPSWFASVGYTLLRSEILKSNTPAEVGKELLNTPENSLSVWATYRLPRGIELGGGASFVDDRFSSNTNTRVAPDYLLFDAMAGYDVTERLVLRLHVNNLTDERYIDRVGGGHFVPGAGRSVSLTTQLKL